MSGAGAPLVDTENGGRGFGRFGRLGRCPPRCPQGTAEERPCHRSVPSAPAGTGGTTRSFQENAGARREAQRLTTPARTLTRSPPVRARERTAASDAAHTGAAGSGTRRRAVSRPPPRPRAPTGSTDRTNQAIHRARRRTTAFHATPDPGARGSVTAIFGQLLDATRESMSRTANPPPPGRIPAHQRTRRRHGERCAPTGDVTGAAGRRQTASRLAPRAGGVLPRGAREWNAS